MSAGRDLGPDKVPIEVWKGMGEVGEVWLTRLFNKIILAHILPNGWH